MAVSFGISATLKSAGIMLDVPTDPVSEECSQSGSTWNLDGGL